MIFSMIQELYFNNCLLTILYFNKQQKRSEQNNITHHNKKQIQMIHKVIFHILYSKQLPAIIRNHNITSIHVVLSVFIIILTIYEQHNETIKEHGECDNKECLDVNNILRHLIKRITNIQNRQTDYDYTNIMYQR